MPDKYVGKRIKELRELQRYTREEFAEEIDISPKFLYEIETGKKNFSSNILCRIADTLSVSCDYIMLGEENREGRGDKIISIIEQMDTKQILVAQQLLEKLRELCDIL